MTSVILGSMAVPLDQVIQYGAAIFAGLFGIIAVLLGAIWRQNERQMQLIEERMTVCRQHDDASHQVLHAKIDRLRKSFDDSKERLVRLEAQVEDRT